MNKQQYRKKTISEPMFVVKYVDNYGQQHQFKSTKLMMDSHRKLMQSNQYIKSFSVEQIKE